MQTSPALLVRAVTAALAFAFGAAQAAGDPDPPTPDKLSAVRARIAEKQCKRQDDDRPHSWKRHFSSSRAGCVSLLPHQSPMTLRCTVT